MSAKWPLGHVHEADCVEALGSLPDESVHLVWTDPPYGINYNDHDLAAARESALGEGAPGPPRPIVCDDRDVAVSVVDAFCREAARILHKVSACCICVPAPRGPRRLTVAMLQAIERHLAIEDCVIWNKTSIGLGWRYRPAYEMIVVARRRDGKMRWVAENSVPNLVTVPTRSPLAHEHPCRKPPALVAGFIERHTLPGELVLDPFAGGGSVGVAAIRMSRAFIGFEIDPVFVRMSEKALEEAREACGLLSAATVGSGGQVGLFAAEEA